MDTAQHDQNFGVAHLTQARHHCIKKPAQKGRQLLATGFASREDFCARYRVIDAALRKRMGIPAQRRIGGFHTHLFYERGIPMDISALITSFNGIVTLVRSWSDFRDAQVVAAVKTELTEKLIQTQLGMSEVLATIIEKDARIANLSDRVRDLETKQSERGRYELREIVPGRQIFAYALKNATELGEGSLEPAHFVCQRCLDESGVKSVLQGSYSSWGAQTLTCNLCKAEIAVGVVK